MTRILCIFLALAFCAGWHAKAEDADSAAVLTAAKCFEEAPFEVIPLLERNTRLDMIDYYNAGYDRSSTNDLGGAAKILSMDPRNIELEYGNGAKLQIFVLDADSKAPLIGVIETIASPIPDSHIAIYDSRWNAKNVLALPTLAQWLATNSKLDRETVEAMLPYIMATYAYDPATSTLSVTHNMDQYFALGEGDKALKLIKPRLEYKWMGSRFKLMK